MLCSALLHRWHTLTPDNRAGEGREEKGWGGGRGKEKMMMLENC